MTEETPAQSTGIYRHQLALFIGSSIVIALLLVVVSMVLYVSGGAIQLDASRPGVKALSDKVDQTDSFKSFPATGNVDQKTLEQFRKLYDEQVRQVTTTDAFNPSVLDDTALGIEAPAADE